MRIVTALVYLFVKLWILLFWLLLQYTHWKTNDESTTPPFFAVSWLPTREWFSKASAVLFLHGLMTHIFFVFFLSFFDFLSLIHCPKVPQKFYLMLIFGAKNQIKKSILFFLIFLAKKEKKSFIAFFTTTRATCSCHHCFALCVNLWVREKLPHHHWKRSSLHLWLNSVSFEVLRKYLNRTKEAHYQCSSLKEPQNDFLHEMKSIWSEKPWFSR